MLHYNLATKQQTVTTTLRTDAAYERTNNEESDDGGDEKKYLKGPNYGSGCVVYQKCQPLLFARDDS